MSVRHGPVNVFMYEILLSQKDRSSLSIQKDYLLQEMLLAKQIDFITVFSTSQEI